MTELNTEKLTENTYILITIKGEILKMLIDSNLFYSLKNEFYSLKGAMDTYGRIKILVLNTQKHEYFYTDAWHDSTKWIELGQFETVSKDLKRVENILKSLDYIKLF